MADDAPVTPDALARLASLSSGLPEGFRSPFQRLGRELLAQAGGGAWRLHLAQYGHTDSREQVARAIEQLFPGSRRVTAQAAEHPDWLALEAELIQACIGLQGAVVQVFGLEHWLDPLEHGVTPTRLRAANLRREAFARAAPAAFVFWLREAQIRAWVDAAPDLWAWRTGVHVFVEGPTGSQGLMDWPRPYAEAGEVDNRTSQERRSRIDALRSYLVDEAGQLNDRLSIELHDEWADLLSSLGELDAALTLRQGALATLCERSGSELDQAINQGKTADILQIQGRWDEAFRIREQHELPVYRSLGEPRMVAATQGRIADILQARGLLDEALRIRQECQLPVFEGLGDARSAAVVRGKMADILHARGRLEEALRIRQDEELPVYERLGDARSAALTRGKIADMLRSSGQLGEALRIYREEVLHALTLLGDVRSVAITQAKIADVLQALGQLDEALRIQREEVLPVYERLGDARAIAALQLQMALVRLQRDEHRTRAGFDDISKGLVDAWNTVQHLQVPDGIAAVGSLLAQMRAMTGQREAALEMLALVDQAQARLGDAPGRQRTAQLRAQVQALAASVGQG